MCSGWYVAGAKNRPYEEGLLFAFFLGPLGVLILACLPIGTAREDAAASEFHRATVLDRINAAPAQVDAAASSRR